MVLEHSIQQCKLTRTLAEDAHSKRGTLSLKCSMKYMGRQHTDFCNILESEHHGSVLMRGS
jgi:hypothetical protein